MTSTESTIDQVRTDLIAEALIQLDEGSMELAIAYLRQAADTLEELTAETPDNC